MEVNARPDDVESKFSPFYDYLEDKKHDKSREVLNQLSELLKNDNGVISVSVALDFENRQRKNTTYTTS